MCKLKPSDSVILTPAANLTLYVNVPNTTDKAELNFERALRNVLLAKGVKRVTDPGNAHYPLQAQVLYVEKLSPTSFNRKHDGGLGGPIGRAVLECGVGRIVGGSRGMWADGLLGLLDLTIRNEKLACND